MDAEADTWSDNKSGEDIRGKEVAVVRSCDEEYVERRVMDMEVEEEEDESIRMDLRKKGLSGEEVSICAVWKGLVKSINPT